MHAYKKSFHETKDRNARDQRWARASQWPWAWAKMVLEQNPETKAQARFWTPEAAEALLEACRQAAAYARLNTASSPPHFTSVSIAEKLEAAIEKVTGLCPTLPGDAI